MKHVLIFFIMACWLQGCMPSHTAADGMKKDCDGHPEMCHKHHPRQHHS